MPHAFHAFIAVLLAGITTIAAIVAGVAFIMALGKHLVGK